MVTRKEREAEKRDGVARRASSGAKIDRKAGPCAASPAPRFSAAAKQAAWRLISPP